MRIPRIYTSQTISVGSTLTLEEQASQHLSRVLRLKEGHPVCLFNGNGKAYDTIIDSITKKDLTLKINGEIGIDPASPLHSHIVIAVSKGEKMDLIVQKCTELGVNEITPILTERSDVKLNTERWQKKLRQWQLIAIGACEQSGRNSIPTIHEVIPFQQWLENTNAATSCLFHTNANSTMQQLAISDHCAMAFGSEGGFSDDEVNQAKQKGVAVVQLGERVMRAETAPIAALAIAQTLWGDFKA